MVNKKQIFGWSVYDFANTIFSALFITVFFPLYVVLLGGTPLHVGLTMSLSMLLAGVTVPFIGALADVTKRKRVLLILFTTLCCLATLITGFVGFYMVLFFAFFANLFYRASLDVYDSFLVDVADKKNIAKVSGIGTAFGYVGTIFGAILAFVVGLFFGFGTLESMRVILPLIALSFFGFSLITFFILKDKSSIAIRAKHFKLAAKQVLSTIRNLKKYKNLWIFLLASFLYIDAASTAIIFLFLYARELFGVTLFQFLPLYLIMAITAGFGALLSGRLADKYGSKKILGRVLLLWIVALLILFVGNTFASFVVASLIGSALLGAVWTTTRPILVEIAPRQKIAELFGYQGLTEKFGGVIGPFLFGYVATFLGFRPALLVIIALFLLGAIVLNFVKS